MFDEYFNSPSIDVSPVPVVAALRAVVLADSPVSTPLTRMLYQQVFRQHKNKNILQTFLKFEHFGATAKLQNRSYNVRYITAKVAGKVVSISEASIRTDLIFDDADGIDPLLNQAIFNAI
ncbi:hypothetical protein Tco_1560904 [Tanacetum coccineum]